MSHVILGLSSFIPTRFSAVAVAILNIFFLSSDFSRQSINMTTPKTEHEDRRSQHKNNETVHSVSPIPLLNLDR